MGRIGLVRPQARVIRARSPRGLPVGRKPVWQATQGLLTAWVGGVLEGGCWVGSAGESARGLEAHPATSRERLARGRGKGRATCSAD